MKTQEELADLVEKTVKSVVEILKDEGLKIPESDQITDIIFIFFLNSALDSIPENLRMSYLKNRLMTLSCAIHACIEDKDGIKKEDIKSSFFA